MSVIFTTDLRTGKVLLPDEEELIWANSEDTKINIACKIIKKHYKNYKNNTVRHAAQR